MWILTLILLILILGVIILVHEFGHFITAKKSGVHIYEFSIGMGPVIKTFKGKDGIDYNIRAFPIGGFVSMAGEVYEDDDLKKIPKDKFMCNKKWWQRIIILGAGVFNNFVLAIVILFVIALVWGGTTLEPKIGEAITNYPAYKAGIRPGDVITAVNNHKVSTWDQAQIYLVMKDKDNIYDIEVKHPNGQKETIPVPLTTEKDNIYNYRIEHDDKIESLNIAPNPDNDNFIFTYQDGKREIVSMTTNYSLNPGEVTITYSDNKTETIKVNTTAKNQYEVTAIKDGNTINYKVTKEIETGKIGISIDQKPVSGFFASLKYAFTKFTSLISTMWITVINLFTGKIGLSSLSGPVGIYHVVGESMKVGFSQIIYLTAFLSINVGLINILPIPAFDGGRIFFLIIEKIKGSPINAKFENMCHTIFFILIILLMIYITIFDIIRFA